MVVVGFFLLTGIGVAYSWYMSQQEEVALEPLPARTSTNVLPSVNREPADNAQVSVSVQAFGDTVAPGSNTSLTIKTLQKAVCSITFSYDAPTKTISRDSGLIPKQADEFGQVNWTWTVTPDVPQGKWPVEVICAYGDKSAYSRTDMTVAR